MTDLNTMMLKPIKHRLLLPILLLLLSLPLLGGCESTPVSNDGTGSTTDSQAATETSAPEASAPNPDEWLPLSENGKPLYTVLYQTQGLEESVSASDYAQTARNIASKLNEKLGGTERFGTASDRNLPEETKVVTVGKIAGYSDSYYTADMRFQDFRIREQDGNVAIACYSPSALYIASEHFLDAVKLIDGDLYVKRSALGETYSSYYQISELTVGGASVADYRIVCNAASEKAANTLRGLIRSYSGYLLPMVTDTEAAVEKEIVVGATSRNSEDADVLGYRIYRQDKKLIVACADQLEWDQLILYVETQLKNITSGTSYDLDQMVRTFGGASNSRKIMSYNVRNVWSGAVGTRDDLTAKLILEYAPDFVCLQEFDTLYRNASGGLIGLISAQYAEVAVSGVSVSDIWNPIFYNSEKYELVESGWVYFPDYVESLEYDNYVGGTTDGKSKFRSLVWAVLRDKSDGSYYVIGNLHFSAERETHRDEAILVINQIKALAAKYEGCTTLVTGDYNSARNSSGVSGLKCMLQNDFYDTYDSAARRNDYGTTHELSTTTPPKEGYMSDAIDHITTLNSDLSVYTYYVIVDETYLPMSDHCATIVQFSANGQ